MPVVGIPLPFISYGGSATIVNFTLVGIVLNVSMRRFLFKKGYCGWSGHGDGAPRRTLETVMGKHDINAFLGAGTRFRGHLTFEGTVRIDGDFDRGHRVRTVCCWWAAGPGCRGGCAWGSCPATAWSRPR